MADDLVGIGRGWETLPLDERVERLRMHAIAQEALIAALMKAVEALGVTVDWGDDPTEEARHRA